VAIFEFVSKYSDIKSQLTALNNENTKRYQKSGGCNFAEIKNYQSLLLLLLADY
jgi:hypothetical protein